MVCICVLLTGSTLGQINSFTLQASGLTCALCARSIHKNLETVSWISKIETDLEKSAFVIRVKPDMAVDADVISRKVEDAGFGVASLTINAQVPADGESLKKDRHLTLSGMTVHILDDKHAAAGGSVDLRLIDKSFLGSKDQKRYAKASRQPCFLTGKAGGDCCSTAGVTEGHRIFHVIM